MALQVEGQTLGIRSFNGNGELVATNLHPGTTAAVEWAPTANGPWSDSWDGLETLTVETNGTIQVNVPMFYRVRGIPSNPNPARLVWIPPGTFTMGSPVTEPERELLVPLTGLGDETQHEVTISQGFWMGKYEVTQAEYLAITGSNPSFFSGTNLPVESVTWYESSNYCRLLTQQEGTAGRLPAGYVYRLPTEAEWEYACRAGTSTVFHYGDALRSGMANFRGTLEYSLSDGGTVSNANGIYLARTAPVGSYAPNAWGLYDMHGNVRERCYDWIYPYPTSSVTDPVVSIPPFPSDNAKIERGGGWGVQMGGVICRSAHRDFHFPTFRHNAYGFRIVLAHPIE
jgi:formylglycine-generating enzyme required for sulfatase activity